MRLKTRRALRFLPEAGLSTFIISCILFTAWGLSGFGQTGPTISGGGGNASTTVLTAPTGECKPRTTFAQGISACLPQTRTVASTGVEYCCCEPDGTLSDFDADGSRASDETTDLDNDGTVGSPGDPQEDGAGERFTYEWYPCQGPGSPGYIYYKASAALGNQIYGRNFFPGTFTNSADVTRNTTGGLQLGTGGTDGKLFLYNEGGTTDYLLTISADTDGTFAQTASYTVNFPSAPPTAANMALAADVDGTSAGGIVDLYWKSVAPFGAGGLCTAGASEVLYNDSDGTTDTCMGALNMTWNKTTNTLSASRVYSSQRISSNAYYLGTDDGSAIYLESGFDGTIDGRLSFVGLSSNAIITLPNYTGMLVPVASDILLVDPDDDGTPNVIEFEGAADGYETTLTATNPTADRTITLPNATGTVALLDDPDPDGTPDRLWLPEGDGTNEALCIGPNPCIGTGMDIEKDWDGTTAGTGKFVVGYNDYYGPTTMTLNAATGSAEFYVNWVTASGFSATSNGFTTSGGLQITTGTFNTVSPMNRADDSDGTSRESILSVYSSANATLAYDATTDTDGDSTKGDFFFGDAIVAKGIDSTASGFYFTGADTATTGAIGLRTSTLPIATTWGSKANNTLFSSYDCDGDGLGTDEYDHVIYHGINVGTAGGWESTTKTGFKDGLELSYCNQSATDLDADGTAEHDYYVEVNHDLLALDLDDADGTAVSRRFYAFYVPSGWARDSNADGTLDKGVKTANRNASWTWHRTGGIDYALTLPPTTKGVGINASAVFTDLTIGGVDANADGTSDTPANIFFNGDTTFTGGGALVFEGSTKDNWEGTLTAANVTADQGWTLPDATGTLVVGAYGEIYRAGNTDAQTLDVEDTFYTLEALTTDGLTENCTLDTDTDADGTAEPSITVTYTGVYRIAFNISFSGSVSETFEAEVYKNASTALTNIHIERKLGTGGDIGSAAASGLASLSAGDDIELKVACTSGSSKAITVRDANLSVVRVK